jgi:hypothetical protein
MPRARALRDYPYNHFGRLFEQVSSTGEELVIQVPTTKALSLRAELYAFKRVSLKNQSEAKRLGIDLAAFTDVRITIVSEGLKLYHKDDSVGVREIEELLYKKGISLEPVSLPQPVIESPTPLPEAGEMSEEDKEASIQRLFGLAKGD